LGCDEVTTEVFWIKILSSMLPRKSPQNNEIKSQKKFFPPEKLTNNRNFPISTIRLTENRSSHNKERPILNETNLINQIFAQVF
jgi:hypothetical protein